VHHAEGVFRGVGAEASSPRSGGKGGRKVAEIIKLTCPACGAKLEVTEDIERFACSYCGNEHIVIRRGGIVTLRPVVEGLERVRIGTDKTASELALLRLEKEMAQLEDELHALQPTYRALVVAVVCWFVAPAIVLNVGADAGAIVFAVVLLVVGIIFFGSWRRINNEIMAERQGIETELRAKQQEYRRHQETVQET